MCEQCNGSWLVPSICEDFDQEMLYYRKALGMLTNPVMLDEMFENDYAEAEAAMEEAKADIPDQ